MVALSEWTGPGVHQALMASADRTLLRGLDGTARSGEEIAHRVGQLAGALLGRGLAGKRIGLWYSNSVAAVEAFLAVEWIGGTRVPLDPDATADEARTTFEAAGVASIIADRTHAALLGDRNRCVEFDTDSQLTSTSVRPVDDAVPGRAHTLFLRGMTEAGLKILPMSYRNWAATMSLNVGLFRAGRYGPPIDADDLLLTVQQLMYGTGLMASFPFLLMGIPQLIVPQFDARIVLAALERFEVTTALMTSTMLPRLTSLARSEGKPKHRLKRLMYGGTTLSLPELQAAMNLFGPVLIQIYGRLEAGWPITLLDQADHEAIARGETHLAKSCGRAVGPPVEFALRAPVPPGDLTKGDLTQTEVCTRSELTIDGFADSDGWCRTGDLAEVDEAGYVYLGGRPDGMINTGYHIYPAEIEKVIRSVDGVADVLVRGEARPTYGHAIVAYIVADDSRSTDDLPNVVTGTLEAKLARHKRPHRLMLVKELPR